MKINIYGVGRSGTKAVQSYIAYHLAKKYERVWINYEPFYFHSRFGSINFNSFWKHYHLPHFISDSYFAPRTYQTFFKQLVQHTEQPIISKFIRGNGRINLINKFTQPDISIVIIRDLYSTISSVLGENWDYYRLGSINGLKLGKIDYFEKIYFDQKKISLTKNSKINLLAKNATLNNNRVIKNSLYWYWMNKYVLSIHSKNTFYLKYDNLSHLPDFLSSKFPIIFNNCENINHYKFKGNLLQSNHVLKTNNKRRKLREYISCIDELLFYTLGRSLNYSPSFSLFQIGESNTINSNYHKIKSYEKIKPIIPKHPLLDQMNEEIMSLLGKNKNCL